ncbi:MAG: TonB-dependent receptor [Acidobacteriota bacterium]
MRPGILCLAWLTLAQEPGQIRGLVVDAQSGEPLARVRVQLAATSSQATTDAKGNFALGGLQAGDYTLVVSTVGYRLLKKSFTLAAGETKEFEVILSPDTFRHTDSVEVRASPFETARADSPSELTLEGNEAKNLASVLADDPLRAVQGMPGVSSNDDFESRFSLRGAAYNRIGLQLDDVLLHTPFHTLQGEAASGSLTAFNGDMVDSIALYSGAFPVRYGDRTAGVLDVHTREGSRTQRSVRLTASASNAGVMAEGPLGRGRRGSWLAAARKSYFQYVIRRTERTEPTLAFGFSDVQGRVSYDLGARHNVSLGVIEGMSDLHRTRSRPRLGINSPMLAGYHYTLANLGWRYTPHARFLVTSRAAYMRERFENLNRDELALAGGYYGEWVWNTNATWMWRARNGLDFGWSLRRPRADGYFNRYQAQPFAVRRLDEYRGHGRRAGAYAQQSWSAAGGRVQLAAGIRWDHLSANSGAAALPQVSVAFLPRPATRIHLGWGQYAQFPGFEWLFSRLGGLCLLPERAIHYVAALEQRLGERSRMRVEFYDREDRDLLFRPLWDARLAGTRILPNRLDAPVHNSSRGYARGFEALFQRRTANRLTGWVSYALGYSRVRDGEARAAFPSDYDQRHTVNIYLGYRVRPSVNLSTRWVYGSGFPIPGFLRREGANYFLAAERNRLRLEAYHRADVRINKAWTFDRGKLTLYGEVVNLFNHGNYRFDSFNGYNARTGQAFITLDRMFPVLPSAGVAVEF